MTATTGLRPRHFVVTSRGVTATRWLSFVLASDPRVFSAHGHFPIASVTGGNFQRETTSDDSHSLSEGGDMREFYDTHTLAEVLDAYWTARPDAEAVGSVHSFTLRELLERLDEADGLPLAIANIVRHPVSYIDSHFSLVRRAEAFPAVYRGYASDVFPRALDRFPELYLVDCPDYRKFLAFVVSCLSTIDVADDLARTKYRHLQMESLTTDADALDEFCRSMTGLVYPRERLDSFITQGAINRHRPASRSKDPQDIYRHWPNWMKDVAAVMLDDTALQRFEGAGYDVEMLRRRASVADGEERIIAPSLADRLQGMDLDHPLLKGVKDASAMQAVESKEPVICEEGYHGFNLVKYGRHVYGLRQEIGAVDFRVDSSSLVERYGADKIVVSNSVEEARAAIDRLLPTRAKKLSGVFSGSKPASTGQPQLLDSAESGRGLRDRIRRSISRAASSQDKK